MKICSNPKCKAENPDNAKFCSKCGKEFVIIKNDPPKKRSTSEKVIITIVVLALGAGLSFIGVGIPILIYAVFKLLPDLWNDKY